MQTNREDQLAELLREAQERPGVAELMRVYGDSSARIAAAHQPQQIRHIITTTSANIRR